jgi:hypothetical protein
MHRRRLVVHHQVLMGRQNQDVRLDHQDVVQVDFGKEKVRHHDLVKFLVHLVDLFVDLDVVVLLQNQVVLNLV